MRRLILPLIFGLAGTAVLVSLGLWQLERHSWKQGVLAGIEARMTGDPVQLPERPDPAQDTYRAVAVTGRFDGADIRVLASSRETGAAYRMISAFDTSEGRRIMVDRGLLPVDAEAATMDGQPATVTGNLHWPDEIDAFTPEPDIERNIWFARDVSTLADALGTEPTLIVARRIEGADVVASPLPVGTESIPDNHLGYAIQWFGMAIVWLGMTAFLVWRIRRQTL